MIRSILCALILCLAALPAVAADTDTGLEKQRQLFQQARTALQTNQLNLYRQYKAQLRGYPLHGYLEYLYLRHRLNQVPQEEIADFLREQDSTFYADRLRHVWLDRLAAQKQWSAYLAFYKAPQSAERACYRLQALLATGQQELAFEDTVDLWLVPKSQHSACDPVFERWQQAGKLTEDLRWQRMLMALRNNQFSLAAYLARTSSNSAQAQAWVQRWREIHDNPLALLSQLPARPPADAAQVSLARDEPLAREIILHGIDRLARRSPEQAYAVWLKLENAYHFTDEERTQARRSIGIRAALNRDERALHYFGDSAGGEWQIRAALWQRDWTAVKRAIERLDIETRQETRWQYWLGRSLAELGQPDAARNLYSAIADQRDYYAFLAADRLGSPYDMNHRPIAVSEDQLEAMRMQPDIRRLHEFYRLDMMLEARREAYHLRQTRSPRELQLVALLTHRWGWHNQTIALLGQARYWDALDLRFPVLYDNEMTQAGRTHQLDPSWLLAIARQESAFNPTARSHAGAMGLMQVMPDTGRLISRLINRPLEQASELYRVERNIELGSAYLRRMYDDHQRNPVLATAAYNAGPGRISRWLPTDRLDADIWLENIPFTETNGYVRSVLSYAAIFDAQRRQPVIPLTERMPAVQSQKP